MKKDFTCNSACAAGKKALTKIFSTKFAGIYMPTHGVATKLNTGKTTLPVAMRIAAGIA